ncbi:MAG: ABC transporter permease [Terracidiphilus sp.]|jgi:peptide/nickel transport system permease protein
MKNDNKIVAGGLPVKEKRHSFVFDLFKRMVVEKPLGTFGLVVIIVFLAIGIFAKYLIPYSIIQINLFKMNQPSSSAHLLGTDFLGRDVLSRFIYGARSSMEVGIGASALAIIISVLIGAPSAYIGGKTDMIVQRFIDVWLSVPPFIVLLIMMTLLPHSIFTMIMVLGITAGIGGARLIRSSVIVIKPNTYISASEAIGNSRLQSLLHHIIPNIMPMIIVAFTLGVGQAIMSEAALDWLGFGLPISISSWGTMNPWPWAPLAISLTIFGINMFGDSLRDLLDPRLRGGVGRYTLKHKKLQQLKKYFAKD